MDWPKCEYCDGKGGQIVQAPAIPGTPDEDWFITCAFCGGTGERPLTADEAAEYIWRAGFFWEPWCENSIIKIKIQREDTGGMRLSSAQAFWDKEFVGGIYEGKDLTAALNAAARAVRDRRQGWAKKKAEAPYPPTK